MKLKETWKDENWNESEVNLQGSWKSAREILKEAGMKLEETVNVRIQC